VADSGCGIPKAAQAAIFDRFVQLDSSATRDAGGAGLGLAICRELAGMMGGQVTVSSAPGKGSVFTLEIPLEKLGESAPLPELSDAPSVPAATRPIRVLAAEDNEVNRIVLQALLSQVDVELMVVGDGAQAVAAWRAQPWDLVLMDIQMPVLDGVSACREIRALEAEAGRPRTPVVAVTANVLPEQRARYREAGMDLVVAKPIDADALFRAIEQALAGEGAEA
jgi:CheY-like chemotaxis protein